MKNMIKILIVMLVFGLILTINCKTVKSADVNISVTWTAPADDGNDPLSGACQQYDMRYAEDSLLLINDWDNQIALSGLPTPATPGTLESYSTIIYMQTGTTYYLAIKSADEVPNWSDISNIYSFYVPDNYKPGKIIDLQVGI